MAFFLELLISVLIVIGGIFALVGSFGLVKLPDLLTRLHAPTKATTLGVGGMLLASMVYFAAFGDGFTIHELLITLFLFITAPITANFIAKAYLHEAMGPAALPPTSTGGETGWATFDDPEPPGKMPAQKTAD